jgi:uncharacterized protein YdaU (DUF1376 family)
VSTTNSRVRRKPSYRSNGLPFFPAYASDWLSSGTRPRLTVEQRGAFWDLLFHAWLQPDGMLPNDEQVLAAYSGLGDRWREVGRTVVELAFQQKGERLFNKRLMKERAIVLARSRQAQKAGQRSGEVRAKRKKKARK